MSIKKNLSLYFFIIGVVLLLIAEFQEHFVNANSRHQVALAEKRLQELEAQMQTSLEEISNLKTEAEFHEYFIHHGLKEQGFTFFYYEKNTLVKWSDSETEILQSFPDSSYNNHLIRLSDGWYEPFIKSFDGKKIIGLVLIKKEFPFENNYLLNHFNPKFGLPENAQLHLNPSGENLIHSISGNKLFSISFSNDATQKKFGLNGWLEFFAIFFSLFAILIYFFQRKVTRVIHLASVSILLIALRWLMISLRFPSEFYSSAFFSPLFYGSSFFFNSAGDLLLNVLTFFCISILTFLYSTKAKSPGFSSSAGLIIALAACNLLLAGVHKLVAGLIVNSKISFEVSSLFNLDGYSVAAVVTIMFLMWTCFFVLYSILQFFKPLLQKRNSFLTCTLSALIIAGVVLFIFHSFQLPALFFSLLLILSTGHIIGRKINLTSNIGTGFVFLFAIYTSLTINYYQNTKEREEMKLFAQRLDTRQDPLAEYLFEGEEQKITADSTIHKLFISTGKINDRVNKHLQQFYFNDYFNKFDVTTICYDKIGMPYDSVSPPLIYFQQQVKTRGRSTVSNKLFFMMNESGRLNYLALLPIKQSSDTTTLGTIVLRLDAKPMHPAESFPDLLVSNRFRSNEAETNYSFARYTNASLIYAYGDFPYSFSSTSFHKEKGDFIFSNNEGYDHLFYNASPLSLIVVSKPGKSIFSLVSLFAFVLFFFSIFFFVSYFFIQVASKKLDYPLSLKQRVRSSILALVLLSFVLISAGTIYYITHKYEQDLDKNILSRLYSLWFSLKNDNLAIENNLSEINKDQWQGNLNNLANIMNLDFNLYDEGGKLFYTSQPKIYEQGITSTRMNPEALFEMKQNERTQYVHPENIGKLKFISAYSPLTSRSGNITGYLNLPYLEKQNELNKEISGFLSALITIYMLLLALAVFIALVISSRITQPLLLIQEKLGNIALGRRNESIEWKHNDEIGALVREYNRMIDELSISAEKLSRSERESAWREMAKQVAHEIKNPLTPMKLHLQHLQRSIKESNEEEMRAAVDRTGKMLIEQIDNLSTIATEFSNFANMPRTKNEILNLRDILSSTLTLFESTPGIALELHDDGTERKIVGDRQQMIRLFSNLVKNALQAIPGNRQGRIDVNVQTQNGFHRISVSDNGAGISAEQRLKIFTPSFTTKTSGMGLGLAIVKSTAEQAGGKVWFETKENEGTTFFVELPSVEN
jgi:two-component system, NtrC family, nitrogen regulation sensor histidine kinase NtrY